MEGINENYAPNFNDFGLHDFINDSSFDQFINLMRGQSTDDHNPVDIFNPNHDNCELMINNSANCFIDYGHQYEPPGQEDLFGYNSIVLPAISEPNSLISSLPSIEYGGFKGGDQDENDGEDDSSETTTTTNTTTPTKKGKGDRSKTLVSERRRRGRMKEKLYALRSLVPNITKMDKASIVGDAVLYVQQLQMQAKKLKAEIGDLESSLVQEGELHPSSVGNPKKIQLTRKCIPVCKSLFQMDIFQVEERGFYVRLVSNKGEGVAISLYKAIESLTGFIIQSSNLATRSDRFVLTFTMNAKELGEGMNLTNLKLWISGALLNQGFEFRSPV